MFFCVLDTETSGQSLNAVLLQSIDRESTCEIESSRYLRDRAKVAEFIDVIKERKKVTERQQKEEILVGFHSVLLFLSYMRKTSQS